MAARLKRKKQKRDARGRFKAKEKRLTFYSPITGAEKVEVIDVTKIYDWPPIASASDPIYTEEDLELIRRFIDIPETPRPTLWQRVRGFFGGKA